MTWAAIVLWLAATITPYTPAACYTPQAEQFAVSMVIGEGYLQPQLAHELMIGAFIEHGCNADPNFFASYAAALGGNSYFRRVFEQPDTFAAEAIRATWHTSLVQHYRINHFAVRLPASWCRHNKIRIGDHEYC